MNWPLFGSAFVSVFLAELGDKTQLATFTLTSGAQGSSKWNVFAGAALALVLSTLIAVLAGEAVSRVISPIWLKRAAGAVFLVLGVVFLTTAGKS